MFGSKSSTSMSATGAGFVGTGANVGTPRAVDEFDATLAGAERSAAFGAGTGAEAGGTGAGPPLRPFAEGAGAAGAAAGAAAGSDSSSSSRICSTSRGPSVGANEAGSFSMTVVLWRFTGAGVAAAAGIPTSGGASAAAAGELL